MKGILTDITKCIGCNRCVDACVKENRLGEKTPFRWQNSDGLSGNRFTSVLHKDGLYVRKQCRHCLEPACASACPVGALTRSEHGAVVYDPDKCLGCRYCMMACPFGIPRYSWDSAVPYIRKCTLCVATRLSAGKQPACTEACPVEATIFGDRDALLQEARNRIEEYPQKYQHTIFGELEVGGTGVIYLSPIPLDFLALGRRLDNTPLPERTHWAMGAVPFAFVTMGALMGGVYWIIERRSRLAEEKGSDNKTEGKGE